MKEKRFMIIGILILLISLVGSLSTYAWFTWSSTNNTSLTMTIGELSDVIFGTGNDISTNKLSPVFNYKDGEKTTFIISNKADTGIKYKILLNITSIDNELKNGELKYKLLSDDSIINEGDFTNIEEQNILYEGELSKSRVNYTFYLYIDGNMDNDINMINKSIKGSINVEASEKTVNLATYITNLYTNAEKNTITNNSIEYNVATSVNLMNDRLGGTTTSLDEGNIRYYGASPNNYIYFNCSDYSNQNDTTCEKWRIIGVFNNQVKLVRDESIGNYAWDNQKKGTYTGLDNDNGSNDWAVARLMNLLNPNYTGIGAGLYWNSGSGFCYSGKTGGTVACDFTSSGIKNDTTKNLISESEWSLLGWYSINSMYANKMYEYERTLGRAYKETSTMWTGKIALAYLSDYAYATDLDKCIVTLNNYHNSSCTSNNWMKDVLGKSSYSWFLTAYSNDSGYVWYVNSQGSVSNTYSYSAHGVFPSLFLQSGTNINLNSNGTITNPYQISL